MQSSPASTVLLLVLALAFGVAACGGAPGPADVDTPPTATASLNLLAKELRFDAQALAAPAQTPIAIHFVNEDAGSLHNIAIYADKRAREVIFQGELITGRDAIEYAFTTPAAGTYYFRCDAHPDMHGRFYVTD